MGFVFKIFLSVLEKLSPKIIIGSPRKVNVEHRYQLKRLPNFSLKNTKMREKQKTRALLLVSRSKALPRAVAAGPRAQDRCVAVGGRSVAHLAARALDARPRAVQKHSL